MVITPTIALDERKPQAPYGPPRIEIFRLMQSCAILILRNYPVLLLYIKCGALDHHRTQQPLLQTDHCSEYCWLPLPPPTTGLSRRAAPYQHRSNLSLSPTPASHPEQPLPPTPASHPELLSGWPLSGIAQPGLLSRAASASYACLPSRAARVKP